MPDGSAPVATLSLFGDAPHAPSGFAYRPEFVSPDEAEALVGQLEQLPFEPFDFRGFKGNRRTVAFGSRYDFTHGRVKTAEPVPDWLRPLRARAAAFAGIDDDALLQALITQYPPGAGIGWHRDRPVFEHVVGVSLYTPAKLRFRRRMPGGFDRFSVDVAPRSAYLLSSEVRHEWEHSITPGEQLRFSITFRTLSELGRRKTETQRIS